MFVCLCVCVCSALFADGDVFEVNQMASPAEQVLNVLQQILPKVLPPPPAEREDEDDASDDFGTGRVEEENDDDDDGFGNIPEDDEPSKDEL